MAEEGGTTLEYTPTWVVAVVCSAFVFISLSVERLLHYLGKRLKKKNQKLLFEALQKIKEELMLLGFISLLLAVLKGLISKICIHEHLAHKWLPCEIKDADGMATGTSAHFQTFFSSFSDHRHGAGRLLRAEAPEDSCPKGKVPLLTLTALDHLHIFIFVLAVAHVTFCSLTILFGGAKIRQWKHWEDSVTNEEYDAEEVLRTNFTLVSQHDFIKNLFRCIGKNHRLLGWMHSFFKQFYGSVNRSDYITLRQGFIMNHCRGNPKFNFHKYMMRAIEADFKKVVGISWYLWVFVVVFLLSNVHGRHAFFWISFIPFILLLAVGTKLEHIITQLTLEAAEKQQVAINGDLQFKPSDDHFSFHKPRYVLVLIHIIQFQNSFEIAVFFWIGVQYGFHSCMLGPYALIIPRLFIGTFVQFLCSYSTLPLYAIVTQVSAWAKQAKKNIRLRKASNQVAPHSHCDNLPVSIQMTSGGGNGVPRGAWHPQTL